MQHVPQPKYPTSHSLGRRYGQQLCLLLMLLSLRKWRLEALLIQLLAETFVESIVLNLVNMMPYLEHLLVHWLEQQLHSVQLKAWQSIKEYELLSRVLREKKAEFTINICNVYVSKILQSKSPVIESLRLNCLKSIFTPLDSMNSQYLNEFLIKSVYMHVYAG